MPSDAERHDRCSGGLSFDSAPSRAGPEQDAARKSWLWASQEGLPQHPLPWARRGPVRRSLREIAWSTTSDSLPSTSPPWTPCAATAPAPRSSTGTASPRHARGARHPHLRPRQQLYPEVVNGRIFVAGGLLNPNTGLSAHLDAYDPATGRWRDWQRLHRPGTTSHLRKQRPARWLRYGHFPQLAGRGGLLQDPGANRWTRGVNLTVSREGASSRPWTSGHVIVGRVRSHPDARILNEHVHSRRNDVFDPSTDTSAARAAAPTARNSSASAVIGGSIYLVGGDSFRSTPDQSTDQLARPRGLRPSPPTHGRPDLYAQGASIMLGTRCGFACVSRCAPSDGRVVSARPAGRFGGCQRPVAPSMCSRRMSA